MSLATGEGPSSEPRSECDRTLRHRPRLPPLNPLRGFDAADQLALIPAPVSHQVRQLELTLGRRLFARLPRELGPTDAGKDFVATVRPAKGNSRMAGLLTVALQGEPPVRQRPAIGLLFLAVAAIAASTADVPSDAGRLRGRRGARVNAGTAF